MATYTISVNERTGAGRSLVAYLRSLSVIVEPKTKPNRTTMKALEEFKTGKVTRCKSFDDYLEAVSNSQFIIHN